MTSTVRTIVRPFVPWEPKTIDPPEAVQRCLTCERPDCTNCLSVNNGNHRRGRPSKYAAYADKLRLFWAQGMTDVEIGQLIGVPKSTVCQWRNRAGLAVNKGYWSAVRAMREATP